MEYEPSERFLNTIASRTEKKLYTAIESALQKRYGPSVDTAIAERVRKEWAFLKASLDLQNVAALYQLTQRMKQQKEPYWLQGTAGASFILYLLGITAGNPLPPHYYCPICHSVTWHNDYADGFDLPSGKVCKKDGILLCRNGHNIPWPVCWNFHGLGRFGTVSPFYVTVARSLRDQVETYLQDHRIYLEGWERSLTISFREDEKKMPIYEFPSSQLVVQCHLEEDEIASNFYDIEPDADYALSVLRTGKIFFEDNTLTTEEGILRNWPVSIFGDLVAKYGLLHSIGVWDKTAYQMVEQDKYSLSRLIAYRDDIFTYLLSHGFSIWDAWEGMRKVCKGAPLPFVSIAMKSAPDRWILERCKRVKYLFPKAHAIEYLLFCIRAGTVQTFL